MGSSVAVGTTAGSSRILSRFDARGFTLIELLVALAILAIVSAVAVPIYTQYSVRTYRAEAQGDLLACAQSMERLASRNFTYAGAVDTNADGIGDADTGAVSANICRPKTTRYNITVQAANANTFTVRATPIAGTPSASNGLLEMTANGTQRWDKDNDGNPGESGEDTWHD
jgi:type IV pilus assembly protein PilE